MDSQGWIAIPLIASFNRIRRLTVDVQLVRDVLTLSSLLQVKDPWVRMIGWEQFVLPDAAPSTVGLFELPASQHETAYDRAEAGPDTSRVDDRSQGEEDEDEDEEDEVVFIMGR